MPAMYLAGLPIPGPDVLELARLVDDPSSPTAWRSRTGEAPVSSPWRAASASRSSARSRTARRPPPSPNSAASCLPSTPAGCATGWSDTDDALRAESVSGSPKRLPVVTPMRLVSLRARLRCDERGT